VVVLWFEQSDALTASTASYLPFVCCCSSHCYWIVVVVQAVFVSLLTLNKLCCFYLGPLFEETSWFRSAVLPVLLQWARLMSFRFASRTKWCIAYIRCFTCPLCCAICYFPVAICYAQQCWIHISILKTFTNVLLFASKLIVDTHFLIHNKVVHTVVWEYYYLSFNILNIFWTQAPGSSILSFFGIVTALSCAKHTILYFNHDPHYHFSPCAGSSEYDCRLGQPQTSYSNIRNKIMKIYCNTLCIHSVI